MNKREQNLFDAASEIVSDFDNYGEVLQTGFDGGYGKDTAIHKLNVAIVAYSDPCESCRKCGETTCGNDTQSHQCFEPRV